jgi:FtsP/CotA-like multicopper oxidase with cupredoxin domain
MRAAVRTLALVLAAAALAPRPAHAVIFVQCPAPLLTQGGNFNPRNPAASTDPGCRDDTSPTFFDTCRVLLDPGTGQPSGATTDPTVVCRGLTAGDGHVTMADGSDTYVFGFRDATNSPESLVMATGMMLPDGTPTGAEFSAPALFARVGQRLYLTLSNVSMRGRPDLADPHSVHFHGFPNAAPVFDGEPMASFGVNMGGSFTYFYALHDPGTYMWHCHIEAAEHMQMGMLGNLYILPRQDGTPRTFQGRTYSRFAYDDCPTPSDPMCGSTGYDAAFYLQEAAFDPDFHYADMTYQKLGFADMNDTYALLNGRGYPQTIDPAPILNADGNPSQPTPAIPFVADAGGTRTPLAIRQGQKLLLRLSSLSTVEFFTLTSLGIPMRVVGQGAQVRRGPGGANTSYATGSVTLGGGEGVDILLDATGVPAGTYFLYTTNLNHLANDNEDFGGMMTKLVVVPAP